MQGESRQPLVDYCMTRLTFRVWTSCFAANIVIRQNADNDKERYPLAAQVVLDSFFMDDGLAGADLEKGAIILQEQLQQHFCLSGLTL